MTSERRRHILVRTQFEALHQWTDAPEDVAFLRDLHRHMFHVELQVQVLHDDRELEFILVKRALTSWLHGMAQPVGSCEMIADHVLGWVESTYQLPAVAWQRAACCTVTEDGENGAQVFNRWW